MENEENNNFENFDGNTLDTDDFQNAGTDIKINPEFYIHISLCQLTKALTKDNMREGLLQYRLLVEHIQRLAVAAGSITDDENGEYMLAVNEFLKKDKLDESKDTDMMKVAQFKLQYITRKVFSSRTITTPLTATIKKV